MAEGLRVRLLVVVTKSGWAVASAVHSLAPIGA